MNNENVSSIDTLRDIKNIMERSARFISLSGWSGIWAGCVALVGSFIAKTWLDELPAAYQEMTDEYRAIAGRFVTLAAIVLAVAIAGGVYFTWKKANKKGQKIWNGASKRMLMHIAVPMLAGGIFSLLFLYNGHVMYIAPACLVFYGLALINGGKYTLSDIQYLGYMELVLGFITMFLPGYGLIFWAIGFGALHIIYGVFMWNKYDKNTGSAA